MNIHIGFGASAEVATPFLANVWRTLTALRTRYGGWRFLIRLSLLPLQNIPGPPLSD